MQHCESVTRRSAGSRSRRVFRRDVVAASHRAGGDCIGPPPYKKPPDLDGKYDVDGEDTGWNQQPLSNVVATAFVDLSSSSSMDGAGNRFVVAAPMTLRSRPLTWNSSRRGTSCQHGAGTYAGDGERRHCGREQQQQQQQQSVTTAGPCTM